MGILPAMLPGGKETVKRERSENRVETVYRASDPANREDTEDRITLEKRAWSLLSWERSVVGRGWRRCWQLSLGRRALIHLTSTKSSIEFLLAARVEEI